MKDNIAILYSRREPPFLSIVRAILFYSFILPAIWLGSYSAFIAAALIVAGIFYTMHQVKSVFRRFDEGVRVFDSKEDAIEWIESLDDDQNRES